MAIWRFWFTHLLGWSEDQVLAFAEPWRDDILAEGSTFYHEVPEYWIAPQFVPRAIREANCGFFIERIAWVIYPLLERYRCTYGLTSEHLDLLRFELRRAIDQRFEELSKAGTEK